MRFRRLGSLFLFLAATAACRVVPAFDASRARAHIDMLAGTIGSRPTGTPANRLAREYLVAELRGIGFDVRIQETLGIDDALGVSAPVTNIIALRNGERRDAIALVSHYDSVPEAMGALDDGIGVATCLEAARELMKAPLRHSLFVIITDGEELGLLGARAVAGDPDVASRVRAFLNFDGTGTSGRALLFEAGPGRAAALDAWARGAASPEGASFTTEIYKRLPNDTDFSIFKKLDAAGVNFAPVGDSYAYHTDRDVAARVSAATLRHEITNGITVVRRLDSGELTGNRGAAPTYVDLFGLSAIVYGPLASLVVAALAVTAGLAAWILLMRDLWRLRRVGGIVMTILWALLSAIGTVGAMTGAVAALRAMRTEVVPWYSAPHWFFLFVLSTGVLVAWMMIRAATLVPEKFRPWRDPRATWWIALPCWIAIGVAIQVAAPTAAYLVMLPLLTAGLLLVIARRHWWVRLASLVTLVVVSACALEDIVRLATFLVALLGWMPLVTPVWLYPAVFAIAALLGAPPLLALMAGLSSRASSQRWVSLTLAAAVAMTGVAAFRAEAYTSARPERRTARYVQDDTRGEAWWEIAGIEPAIGVGSPAGGTGTLWASDVGAPTPNGSIGRLNFPSVYRTSSAPRALAPADVTIATAARGSNQLDVVVKISPRENLVARIVLEPGLTPATSSLAGRVVNGQWIATLIAPPATGLTATLTFDGWTRAEPPRVVVTLTTVGLPGGEGRLRLPDWLPQATTTWRARSVFVVAPRQ